MVHKAIGMEVLWMMSMAALAGPYPVTPLQGRMLSGQTLGPIPEQSHSTWSVILALRPRQEELEG